MIIIIIIGQFFFLQIWSFFEKNWEIAEFFLKKCEID